MAFLHRNKKNGKEFNTLTKKSVIVYTLKDTIFFNKVISAITVLMWGCQVNVGSDRTKS